MSAAAAGFNGVKLLLLVHCVFLYVCVLLFDPGFVTKFFVISAFVLREKRYHQVRPLSVRVCVCMRMCVCMSASIHHISCNASPPKSLDIATANFAGAQII